MLSALSVNAQKEMPLYDGAIPNAKPCSVKETSKKEGILIISDVTVPTLTAYIPPKEKQNGAAVLVIPGGGYGIVAAGHEGSEASPCRNRAGEIPRRRHENSPFGAPRKVFEGAHLF